MADDESLPPPAPAEPAMPAGEPTSAPPADEPVLERPKRPSASPTPVLVANALRSWFSAKGFILVVVATLLPVVLAGAWIGTHQRDVSIVTFDWNPPNPFVNQEVTFNATVENPEALAVGNFTLAFQVVRLSVNPFTRQITQSTELNETIDVGGLGPGERKTLNASWTPNAAAYYVFIVQADPDYEDKVAELEEYNNFKQSLVEIQFGAPDANAAPRPPTGLEGERNSTTTVDLAIEDLRFTPDFLDVRTNATFEAVVVNRGAGRVENARVTLRLGEAFGGSLAARNTTVENVTLEPGASTTVQLKTQQTAAGGYWVEAFVAPPGGARDTAPADNYRNRSLAIAGQFESLNPPPVERRTIKEFYLEILLYLTLPIVLPFIALFYAAGAVSDEREKGNLTYLLTRPFGRGSFPIVKFIVSFVVASVAVLVGVAAMYLVLLGTPERDPGYLTTPLIMSLVTLFVYGAFFTMIAVVVNRAYLAGIAFVLGWEYLVPILINLNLLASHVKWFTILHHLQRILRNWSLDQSQWVPTNNEALESLRYLGLAALVFLGLAYYMMRGREFEV